MLQIKVDLKEPILSKSSKFKQLLALEKQLNEQFKTTNSLVKLGDKVGIPIPSICTNLPNFDWDVVGTGGIPRGRIVEVFGPESSGKTTFALHVIGSEQRSEVNAVCAFVDAEHALDPTYAQRLGVNVDELIISQPGCGEEALETVEALIDSGAVSLIVVDSVDALVPRVVLEGEMGDSHMGVHARLMSQACRKLNHKCKEKNVTVIFINQIREKIGVMFGSPEVTTGGRALKFYASLRIDVRRRTPIKSGDVLIGHSLELKAVKNKVGTPLRSTIIDLLYEAGFDTMKDFIEYAIKINAIEKSGAWYKFDGNNIGQGLDKTVDNLKYNNKLLKEVQNKVKEIQEITSEGKES
jgi:recombination protein RecA